ncbi:polysaccharide ABC transporter ATP-binding protein [Polluticoccus soli]|uniref:ABC transporter ATP-binding protein n=1 Tax=Polluticoccus soli TaxID=3034150 RepID=UPI0023E14D80|nr:polysaccharide ABC transporter ATP-binding protein [Flavipsychrobacter sp. JY13-12]
MSKVVIKVEDLSKQYRLGSVGTGYLKDDISRYWSKLRGKDDPFLKIGEANDRTTRGDSEYVWAIKNVNFDVNQGEVLGVVGRNGAGKSTLLKLLSRVTKPTSGSIKIKGRIASLLEVGTGFHPDLTGRENIFLNGAILGMTKAEIAAKFDEIVAFAGVERYIDTPVKRYSSGMYVRLAFAVAAHLQPEILIVDEVLAVGDAEFQKKCIGKMRDVSHNEGRTVIFVSHNMQAVSNLCDRCLLIEQGSVAATGRPDEIITRYLAAGGEMTEFTEWQGNEGDENGALLATWVRSLANDGVFDTSSEFEVGVKVQLHRDIEGLILGFWIYSQEDSAPLAYILYDDAEDGVPPLVKSGVFEKRFIVPANLLSFGNYKIKFDFGIHNIKAIGREGTGSLSLRMHNYKGGGRRFNVGEHRHYSGLFRPMVKVV